MNARKTLLALTACPLVALAGGSPDSPDYVVTEGVHVAEGAEVGPKVYYGVYDPAMVVFSVNKTTNPKSFSIGGVVGNGVISNAYPGTQIGWSGGSPSTPVEFSGTLANDCELTLNGDAHVRFTNDAIDKSITWRIYGELGVTSIGMAGQPSAMGTHNRFWISDANKPGTLFYMGQGEHTDKTVNFNRSGTLNAGTNGDAFFEGGLYYAGAERPMWIALTGDNAKPAVIAGAVDGCNAGKNTSAHFIKRGTGTWRFADVAQAEMLGAVSVERGTLEYASIAEAGTACSLGTATMLYEPIESTTAESIPYACTIGNGIALDAFAAPTDDLATFTYVGTADAKCSTRLIGIKGAGRLVNGSDKAFCWEGVTAADEASSTLVLDGSGTSDSVASVSNGVGKIGIVKTGTGTWTLKNNLDFTGGLDVRGGTLKVGYDFCRRYRFIVKEVYNGVIAQIKDFVFLDADGNNITAEMSYRDDLNNQSEKLSAGETCYLYNLQSGLTYSCEIGNFFQSSVMWQGVSPNSKNNYSSNYILLSKPNNWIKFEFCLPQDVKVPVRWDFASNNGNGTAVYDRNPTCYELQGSLDGVTWETLTEVVSNHNIKAANRWFSNNTPTDTAEHGYTINAGTNGVHFLESVEYVAVSGGAMLATDYPVSTAELRVDVDGNGGTIKGISFAKSGVIRLSRSTGRAFELPILFEDVEGLDNLADWQVKIGERSVSWRVTVSDAGKVTLIPPGCLLIVR